MFYNLSNSNNKVIARDCITYGHSLVLYVHIYADNTNDIVNKHIRYKRTFKLSPTLKHVLGISEELELFLFPMLHLVLDLKQQEL